MTEPRRRRRAEAKGTRRLGAALLLLLVVAAPARAQTAQATPTEARPSGDADKKPDQASTGTSDDRLFWTLPNFLTVENTDSLPPLTTKQKFNVTFRSSFDPIEIPWYAMVAAVSQAGHQDPTYGQGALGYGKRVVLAATDSTIENLMINAIAASTFREDPRYYQRGQGGAWYRVAYAVSRLVVTRSDQGRAQVNFAEILGSGTATGLSRIYHPAGDRTVASTLSSWGAQMGYDGLALVLKEFWPDIRRKFSKH